MTISSTFISFLTSRDTSLFTSTTNSNTCDIGKICIIRIHDTTKNIHILILFFIKNNRF